MSAARQGGGFVVDGVRFRLAALALAAVATSFGAQAAPTISASVDFDGVASGSTANAALGALQSNMHFSNPDIVLDFDENGYTGTFHWVDATSTYGDVLVGASDFAVSGPNVLTNGLQPIMLVFAQPVDLVSFAIQQDLSGYGNPQYNGSTLAFLDSTGHELPGTGISYTQFGQPGLLLQTTGTVGRVSAVLLSGGTDYDNLALTATVAVPEPGSSALLLGGLGTLAWLARRRRTAD